MEMEQNTQGRIKALFGELKNKAFGLASNTRELGKDDPRRIAHSLKVALALTFVSLFYYFRPLYDGFGASAIWAVLTVVVVFEFSVGATLSKSMNRGFGTLLAGALGVGAAHLASFCRGNGEVIILGVFIFILAATSTFVRFFPRVKSKYDYGVLIFILTFSLVSISGYRVEEILELAHQRLSTILIGGATSIVLSISIFPVWAGEDLHKLVATNIEKLAIFLEGFSDEFLRASGYKEDRSFLESYKSVLNTKNTEESLANFAWWEPCHGRFRIRHPWKLYLKIGVLTRKCAYHFATLSNYLNIELQRPTQLQNKLQEPCMKISSQSAKALKEMASSIKAMTHTYSSFIHLRNSKIAVNELNFALQNASFDDINATLSEILPTLTAVAILKDIVKCVEEISNAVTELSEQAKFKKKGRAAPQLLHRGTVNPLCDGDSEGDRIVIAIHEISSELPREELSTQPPKASLRVEV